MRCSLKMAMLLLAVGAVASSARAQGSDSAAYCEPAPQTKLIYSNRAYLIMQKPADAPPLAYSYSIIGTERSVVRAGQILFDDGGDRWAFESNNLARNVAYAYAGFACNSVPPGIVVLDAAYQQDAEDIVHERLLLAGARLAALLNRTLAPAASRRHP